jgi:hypothetical protein
VAPLAQYRADLAKRRAAQLADPAYQKRKADREAEEAERERVRRAEAKRAKLYASILRSAGGGRSTAATRSSSSSWSEPARRTS